MAGGRWGVSADARDHVEEVVPLTESDLWPEAACDGRFHQKPWRACWAPRRWVRRETQRSRPLPGPQSPSPLTLCREGGAESPERQFPQLLTSWGRRLHVRRRAVAGTRAGPAWGRALRLWVPGRTPGHQI